MVSVAHCEDRTQSVSELIPTAVFQFLSLQNPEPINVLLNFELAQDVPLDSFGTVILIPLNVVSFVSLFLDISQLFLDDFCGLFVFGGLHLVLCLLGTSEWHILQIGGAAAGQESFDEFYQVC